MFHLKKSLTRVNVHIIRFLSSTISKSAAREGASKITPRALNTQKSSTYHANTTTSTAPETENPQMQRGRPNRQTRPNDETTRGRGTPRGQPRGRGRGRGQGPPRGQTRNHDPDLPRVPAHSSIPPGTGVSIVLKEDQATGHQVRGIVAELLTRGDHPRGVKVRLRDGRVGRVQRLVSESEGLAGEAVVGGAEAGLGRNGEGAGARGERQRGGRTERDIREEDGYLYDEGKQGAGAVDAGYFAALEEGDRRHEEGRGGKAGLQSEVVKCPVCGAFEGDERAVAHHVEGHFAE